MAIIFGTPGNDNLFGTADDDELYGLAGDDILFGFDGDDLIDGGDGDDTIDGGGGNDTVSYALHDHGAGIGADLSGLSTNQAGNEHSGFDTLLGIENIIGTAFGDYLTGDGESNVFIGGGGDDTLTGGGGNDVLRGGADDDLLAGQEGDDLLDGGEGWDRISYSAGAIAGITIDLRIKGVSQDTGSQGMDTLIGIEHVMGTRFDDVIRGDDGDNWIWGGSGGSGSNGNDILRGGRGNDLIEVGAGNHFLRGGRGTDALSFYGGVEGRGDEDLNGGITVSLAIAGTDQDTTQGIMNLRGFENLSGSVGPDTLIGDNGENLLAGDEGDDILIGGKGDDVLYGDGRVSVGYHVSGMSGPIRTIQDVNPDPSVSFYTSNDDLRGGDGDDVLLGGFGDDVMTGGKGQDVFIFGYDDGNDRIVDFKHQDIIRFQADAGVAKFSDLVLVQVGNDTLITGLAGHTVDGGSILIEGIRPHQLHASDFVFDAAAGVI